MSQACKIPVAVRFTRTSPVSGKINEMVLDVSADQMERYWASNENIQDVFPNLTAEEREFILTGITPEEWDEMLPPEER
jgi:hypothetical protein